jgi:hypothetical protein
MVQLLEGVLVDLMPLDLLDDGDDRDAGLERFGQGATSSVAAGPFCAATTGTRPEIRA